MRILEDIAEKELDQIRLSTRQGEHYISERFREQIAALLPKKRRRGRPRKNNYDASD